jgi:hypothetical protein
MAYHHRTATLALALALAAGVPAAAAAQQPGQPSSPAPVSPCSEVCSGGGYTSVTSTTTSPAYSLPIILNDLGSPAPCSEVCSGGGYGSVSQPSWTPDDSGARLPHDSRPRSVVLSSGYNTASVPPAAMRVVTHSGGFDWGDAGIGAGGMLALIVIALGGALTLTRRRNHHIHGHTPQNGRSAEKRAADQTV